MPRIIQTSVFDNFLKNNSADNGDTTRSAKNPGLSKKYSDDGVSIWFNKAGNSFVDIGDMIMILPYDVNIYDEIESLFFVVRTPVDSDSCHPITRRVGADDDLVGAVVDTLESCGIILPKEDMSERIKRVGQLRFSENILSSIYPFFVNVSGATRKNDVMEKSGVSEVDVIDLWRMKMKDIGLLYMISIIKDVV